MPLLRFPTNIVNLSSSTFSPADFSISCGDCLMAGSSACDDCVVTLLCDDSLSVNATSLGQATHRLPVGPEHCVLTRRVDLSADEAAVIDLFANVGLAPRSRHRRKLLAG